MPKILVVDDEPDNIELVSQILKDDGYDVIAAENGCDAIEIAVLDSPDLILLDIMMPDMDGYEVCSTLSRKKKTSDIPVIMLTAKALPEDLRGAFEVGAHDYIRKPFEEVELITRVQSALKLKQSKDELKNRNIELLCLTERLQTANDMLNRDIAERKRVEKALRESEGRYTRLIGGISGYTYSVKSDNGKPVSTTHSSGCLAVTGYSAYEYEVDPFLWFSMIHKVDQKMVQDHVNRLLSGIEVSPIEHRILRRDGTVRWVRNTFVVKRDRHGSIVAYDGIVEDITERKLAEEELRKSKEELQGAYEELKELDKMKTEFAAIATHEIGTPLSVINSNIEMLEDGIFGEIADVQRERLKVIRSNVNNLIRLNREMMDISRIDAGRLKLRLEPCSLSDIAKEVTYEMETLVEDKGMEISLEVPDGLPTIDCDKQRLRQVFSNLISNAVKYTPEGGKIYLNINEEKNYLIASVKDDGIGIPKDEQKKIFKRFYEIGDYLEHETGGAGLGLSIVKGIVEAHNGKVWVESDPGKGSTFFFTVLKEGVK